jgi:hypothetical protein
MITRYFIVYFALQNIDGSIHYGMSHHADKYGNYVKWSHLKKSIMENDSNIKNVMLTGIQELSFDDYDRFIS